MTHRTDSHTISEFALPNVADAEPSGHCHIEARSQTGKSLLPALRPRSFLLTEVKQCDDRHLQLLRHLVDRLEAWRIPAPFDQTQEIDGDPNVLGEPLLFIGFLT